MSTNPETVMIFDPSLRRLRRERAKRRNRSFLLERVALDAADRIGDVNRRFENCAIIGLPVFAHNVLSALPADKKPKDIDVLDDWPDQFAKDYDLIISGLVLQSLNDVPGAILSARKALRPDGLFLSAFIGGESLLRLKRACFAADQHLSGGYVPRVAPMIDYQQAAGLLGRAGFALPVIDKDVCQVRYRKFETLVSDLRDVGETNILSSYKAVFGRREFPALIRDHYPNREEIGGDPFLCLFEILWMTGWAPHDSQQKPLKPGSAQVHLSDALNKLKS